MNKKQAEEYYQQLKRMEKSKGMQLEDVIHILTSGSISPERAREFIAHVSSNQFGDYSHVYESVEQPEWKKLTFAEVYEVLKYLKVYIKRQRAANPEKHESERGGKEMMTSFDSKQANNTVQQILSNMKEQPDKQDSMMQLLQSNHGTDFESRGKMVQFKLVKKLLIIFDFLRKSKHIEGESFDKNRQVAEHMDLTMFMKYIKLFELGNAFKTTRIIKAFKENAVNTLWVDFDQFVNTNLAIISVRTTTPAEERYLRLKGLYDLVRSENMKKMLNIRGKTVLATIVEGHTGTYKQDILDFLHGKYEQRVEKEKRRWSSKRLNTLEHKNVVTSKGGYSLKGKVVKSHSANKLSLRVKTQASPSIYQELKLPPLRVKERKHQSIYESLKSLDVSSQKQKLKQLINLYQNEEYLDQYLKEEAKTTQHIKKRTKKLFQLPAMRFT